MKTTRSRRATAALSGRSRPVLRLAAGRADGEEAPAETSRRRILDAALRLLAKHGYDGMSLQQIADEVSLHKATLFHHFAGKREIALEVWHDVLEPLRDHVRALDVDDEVALRFPQLQELVERNHPWPSMPHVPAGGVQIRAHMWDHRSARHTRKDRTTS